MIKNTDTLDPLKPPPTSLDIADFRTREIIKDKTFPLSQTNYLFALLTTMKLFRCASKDDL